MLSIYGYSQTFTDVTSDNVMSLAYGAIKAADFNNDKKMDFLNVGVFEALGSWKGTTILYSGSGDFTFQEVTGSSIDSVFYASAAWGDFNNDGNLDFLVGGDTNGGYETNMYFGDGKGGFIKNTSITMTSLAYSDIAAGDLNRDGDLDFVMIGSALSGARMSLIYINNGDSTFTEDNTSLYGVGSGSVSLGDFDVDGDLDILISGEDGSVVNDIDQTFTKLYVNHGDGSFDEQEISVDGVKNGDAEWIDSDMDGDLDIILTGYNGSDAVTNLYTNDGGVFSKSAQSFTAVLNSTLAVADISGDGYPDIINSGFQSVFKIYINDQKGGFTELTNHGISGFYGGTVELSDIDNDRDLDILFTGDSDNGYKTKIYQNNLDVINQNPSAPTNITYKIENDSMYLAWDAAEDLETPSNGLFYNYWISHEGDTLVYASSFADGKTRKMSDWGNMGMSAKTKLSQSMPGDYVFGVQTIDQTLNASEFATVSFHINYPPTVESVQDLSINEDDTLTFNLSYLTVNDPDNTFPDDFTFTLYNGANFQIDEDKIIPAPNYNGTLHAEVKVFDGQDSSDVFSFNIEVIPVNDPPEVSAFNGISSMKYGESFSLSLDEFVVVDVDNDQSSLSLEVLEGDHYSYAGLKVIPEAGFTGDLNVNIDVSDGQDSSDPYEITVQIELPLAIENDFILKVYPNPATEIIYIKSDNNSFVKAELQSLSGQKIPLTVIDSSIKISGISTGVYILNLRTEKGQTISKKVLIK